MAERLVKVRCQGEVKRLRLTCNIRNIHYVIRQRFGIPANAAFSLTMVLEGNRGCLPLNEEQTLQYHWDGNDIRELQVMTPPLQVQRALVNDPDHDLQTVVAGWQYRIDEPPSRNSPIVQQYRIELGIAESIDDFKGLFQITDRTVEELHRSISAWKASAVANNNMLVSKSKSVVKGLVDIFENSQTAFEMLNNLCITITAVCQQLRHDLVNGNHQAAVRVLQILMSTEDKMEKVARKLEDSIGRSMREIEDAIKTIASERKAIEAKVKSTEEEQNKTEEILRQQSQEIENLERKLAANRNEVAQKEKDKDLFGTAYAVGVGLTIVGVLIPPLLPVGITTVAGSTLGHVVADVQIKNLEIDISAAKEKKDGEEKRKKELQEGLSVLKSDQEKLEAIGACLNDVWGQMIKIKSTVLKMESFWPRLNDISTTIMESERRMVATMGRDNSRRPLRDRSVGFEDQIVNLLARSDALQELCQSCLSDVSVALSNLRPYQDLF